VLCLNDALIHLYMKYFASPRFRYVQPLVARYLIEMQNVQLGKRHDSASQQANLVAAAQRIQEHWSRLRIC